MNAAHVGLNHMHTRSILYRDLKPEKVLIGSDGYPILVDFGFARKVDNDDKFFTLCGSPFYIAPEVVLGIGEFILRVVYRLVPVIT